jgi:cytochrome c2
MSGLLPKLAPATACLLLAALAGCSNASSAPPPAGDAAAGAALIVKLGCGSCHTIPGIVDATGLVGPPLDHMASRQYVAGVLRNTPDNMVQWLRFPQQVVPGNAMPDLAISRADAQRIAAYLATLK